MATSAVPDEHGYSNQFNGKPKVAPVVVRSNGTAPLSKGARAAVVQMRARHSRKQYMQNVRECLQVGTSRYHWCVNNYLILHLPLCLERSVDRACLACKPVSTVSANLIMSAVQSTALQCD